MKIGHNFGFTLAEVLITLAIIGVVAAMTLPTLIQNQQKRSLEVATQKFYSNMSQAVKKYMADEGYEDLRNSPLEFSLSDSIEEDDANEAKAQKACDDFVQKYLKVAKVCEDGCFADNYTTQNGEISDSVGTKAEYKSYSGKFVLADGAVLDITPGYVNGTNPMYLLVDINGKKGPNKIGYDLWYMDIFYDGSIDESGLTPECKKDNKYCAGDGSGYSPKELRDYYFDTCKSQGSGGHYGGCFGHFLENGFKFDY